MMIYVASWSLWDDGEETHDIDGVFDSLEKARHCIEVQARDYGWKLESSWIQQDMSFEDYKYRTYEGTELIYTIWAYELNRSK